MDEFSNISVIPYPDEVLVELTGTDEQGEIVVLTYQFEFTDIPDQIRPKEAISSSHENAVQQALEENGYTVA